MNGSYPHKTAKSQKIKGERQKMKNKRWETKDEEIKWIKTK